MQPFRIREDARNWFKELLYQEKTFRTDFDAFYFCFMTGITARKKRHMPNDKTAELVPYFPDKYQSRGKLLVGLFLTRELKELGLEVRERHSVHKAIAQLVSSESSNYLTTKGVGEFNKYAHAGFDMLLEWFDDRPRSLETFLRAFQLKLDVALADKS